MLYRRYLDFVSSRFSQEAELILLTVWLMVSYSYNGDSRLLYLWLIEHTIPAEVFLTLHLKISAIAIITSPNHLSIGNKSSGIVSLK